MKIKAVLTAITLILSATISCAASGPEFQEGQWETSVTLDSPGLPMAMQPDTDTQCMRRDNFVPRDENPDQKWETNDIQTKGNHFSWEVTCTAAGGETTGKGNVTYRKGNMDGTMAMESQCMVTASHFSGKRIGS